MDTTTHLHLLEDWFNLWHSGYQVIWENYQRWWQMASMTELGRQEVGQTSSTLLWQEERIKLWRYNPTTPSQHPIPVVCVPSLINRHYILDLLRGRSLVAYLLSRGLNVFMLDWGNPTLRDKTVTLDTHIAGYMHRAIAAACQQSGSPQVILLGYCLGGTFSTIYTSLFPTHIAGLVNLAGPINFNDNGIFSFLTHADWFNADLLVDTLGNIPAPLLCQTFQMLHPTNQLLRALYLMERLDDPEYVRHYAAMQTWIFDQVDFPGELFRHTIKDLYQANKLVNNQLTINGQTALLETITCPVLTIASPQDETAPGESVAILHERVNSQHKQLLMLNGPHIGMVAGHKAPLNLWQPLADWLVTLQ